MKSTKRDWLHFITGFMAGVVIMMCVVDALYV